MKRKLIAALLALALLLTACGKSGVDTAAEPESKTPGDAGEIAEKLAAEDLRPDVICVDPPRKGLGEDVIAAIDQMAPKQVVYVSCDPATLGRDVKRFAGVGYMLREAVAVDMFPRTAHVETVVSLERQGGAGSITKEGIGWS